MISIGGDVASKTEKGENNVAWADVNLTGLKSEENSCG
jgi:hypothetical protein